MQEQQLGFIETSSKANVQVVFIGPLDDLISAQEVSEILHGANKRNNWKSIKVVDRWFICPEKRK